MRSAVSTAVSQAKPPGPRLKLRPGVRPTGRSLHVLLAEDNEVNQLVARGLLEMAGHTVEIAQNGAEVSPMLAASSFDVVLMDVQMPEMDGFEATALIREAEKDTGAHIPVIAMTAHAMSGYKEKCLEAGMDGYVSKPIRPEQLFQALADCQGVDIAESGSGPV